MNNYIGIELLYEGHQRKLYAIKRGDVCQVCQYIEGLPTEDERQIVALLRRTANNGPPRNEQKFRSLKGVPLYEFKTRGKVRLICFFEKNNIIILTHGFDKPKRKKQQSEIDIAYRIMKEFQEKWKGIP